MSELFDVVVTLQQDRLGSAEAKDIAAAAKEIGAAAKDFKAGAQDIAAAAKEFIAVMHVVLSVTMFVAFGYIAWYYTYQLYSTLEI